MKSVPAPPPAVIDALGEIEAASATIEAQGGLSDALFDRLVAAGCYRMLIPERAGGTGATVGQVVATVEALATADASAAWVVGQSALGQLLMGFLPPAQRDIVYSGGPDLPVAGVFTPGGRARASAEDWTVSGTWRLASGIDRARWVYVHALVVEGRRVCLDDAGTPITRLVVLPRSTVEVHDTWHALGLRGTASRDVSVRGARSALGCRLEVGGFGAISPASLEACGGLFVAAVASGIALGALGDVAAIGRSGKRAAFRPTPLGDSVAFLGDLGASALQWRAAHTLLGTQAVLAGERVGDPVVQASLQGTAHEVTRTCVRVVDEAWRLAGATPVLDGSSLQRRLRDLRTATQHAWNRRDHAVSLGRAMLSDPNGPRALGWEAR